MVMPYHLHMPSYFLETFTEYPSDRAKIVESFQNIPFMLSPTSYHSSCFEMNRKYDTDYQ